LSNNGIIEFCFWPKAEGDSKKTPKRSSPEEMIKKGEKLSLNLYWQLKVKEWQKIHKK